MLKVGNKAPAFNLVDQDEEKVTLKDLAGKKAVIYFYPKDNTPGCTTESIDFTKLIKKFEKKNTVILGVSKDSVKSHCNFIEKHKLKVRLLSDPEGKMIEKYGAWGEKNNYGKKYMGVIRSTVLLSEEGKVIKHWPSVKVKGHAEEVLESID